MSRKLSKTEIRYELWRRGELSFKFHKVQKEMTDTFKKAEPNSTSVFLLPRQIGKSYYLALLGAEQCIQQPYSIVKILTDTKLHIKTILEPIFREILQDCPDDVKPSYIPSQYLYQFPNGSQIQMAGSDGGSYERLRGQKCHLALVDEAGFVDNLEYIVTSVLLPTLTHTGGKIVLASTPPLDPDHDFIKFIELAEMNGSLIKKTIYDNPLLSDEQIQQIIKQMGGEQSEKFRREYLCHIIRDENNSVIPEATDDLMKEIAIDWKKPPFYDSYISMDLGYHDLTALIFAYYDFLSNKIIIQDEFCIRGKDMVLPELAQRIMDKQKELWSGPTGEVVKPHKCVSDINYIVTQELGRSTGYQLNFITPQKDDKIAAINDVRTKLASRQIIINPKCTNLLRHIKNGRWKNTDKLTYARSPDDGHYDFIDALIYLVRSITYTKNPYPSSYQFRNENTFVYNKDGYLSDKPLEVYKQIFGVGRFKKK